MKSLQEEKKKREKWWIKNLAKSSYHYNAYILLFVHVDEVCIDMYYMYVYLVYITCRKVLDSNCPRMFRTETDFKNLIWVPEEVDKSHEKAVVEALVPHPFIKIPVTSIIFVIHSQASAL